MRKGFTFVELMGVIIILGLIALIVTPNIIDSIDDNKKTTFTFAANAIVQSVTNYYQEQKVKVGFAIQDMDFSIDRESVRRELNLLESDIQYGTIHISKDGEISMAVSNGVWCATKEASSTQVVVEKNPNCKKK